MSGSVQAAGFTPWETIPANTLFRVTFVEDAPLGVTLFPGALQDHVPAVYASLYSAAKMIPTTSLYVQRDDKSTVVDAMLKVEMTGAELLRRLASLNTLWVAIARAERLTGKAREQATSQAGAETRYLEAEKMTQTLTDNAWTKSVASALGTSLKTALAVIVVAVLLIVWNQTRRG